jgi:hypothetical protein
MENSKPAQKKVAKPYFDLEIRVIKGITKIAQFTFPRDWDIQKCLLRCVLSPQAMIKLKALQLRGRNWQSRDCLTGELIVEVWEVAGDSSGNRCYEKMLDKLNIK